MALSYDTVVIILWGFEAIGFVVAGVKFYNKKRERDWEQAEDGLECEIERAKKLLGQFLNETGVLSAKLQNEESICPEARRHYEATYEELMPLLRAHAFRFDRHLRESREAEGDYSNYPGIVKDTEDRYSAMKSMLNARAQACYQKPIEEELIAAGIDGDTKAPEDESDENEWEMLGRRFAEFTVDTGHTVWMRFLPEGVSPDKPEILIISDVAPVLRTFCVDHTLMAARQGNFGTGGVDPVFGAATVCDPPHTTRTRN
ncbi:MAG: hypothetical protein CXZ00_02445 [Acidobacteria bacterium]|nr:MAG: hypothetical protein CXZ00_02445 [Acidobacteriota bacterium]